MSKQHPPAPTARAVGPCDTLRQISRTPRHWKLGWFGWLFRFNGPLRQYFSLYRAVSQRGRKKKDLREKMSKRPPPAPIGLVGWLNCV